MTNNFVHDASIAGSGASIASGLILWFGENATAVGAITTAIVGILTIIFQLLNYRLNKARLEFDRRNTQKAEK